MIKKILVVDDEPDILRIVTFRLKVLGCKIITAVDGQDAIGIIKKEKPDLIFLDLRMPILDGYEVCRFVKTDDRLKGAAIILLTASNVDAVTDRTRGFEADDYLIKPFEPEELLGKARKFIGERVRIERKILVIEDNSDICKILECRLKEGGFEVIIARDGEEGLVKAQSENPDLILLDLKIPKLPGEEVCKEIRKNENLCNIPIIMLTAKDTDADRIVGKVVGADCYMTKPFDMDDLRAKIDGLTQDKEKA